MSLTAIADALEAAAAELRRHAAADTDTLPLPLEGDGWVECSGHEQPPETYGKNVDVQLRDGDITGSAPAAVLAWYHDGNGSDILRYRISAEQPAT